MTTYQQLESALDADIESQQTRRSVLMLAWQQPREIKTELPPAPPFEAHVVDFHLKVTHKS